jgi:hypothetical protein
VHTQIRIDKITIEVPSIGDEIWVHLEVQQVQWNDDKTKVLNVVPRAEYSHRTAASQAMVMHPIMDIVQQKEIIISGYAVHKGLEQMAMDIVQQDHGGAYDEDGTLWLS